jgi:hypothetical protein
MAQVLMTRADSMMAAVSTEETAAGSESSSKDASIDLQATASIALRHFPASRHEMLDNSFANS